MKYLGICNTVHVAVINMIKYKYVIWNRFPKSSHILFAHYVWKCCLHSTAVLFCSLLIICYGIVILVSVELFIFHRYAPLQHVASHIVFVHAAAV